VAAEATATASGIDSELLSVQDVAAILWLRLPEILAEIHREAGQQGCLCSSECRFQFTESRAPPPAALVFTFFAHLY